MTTLRLLAIVRISRIGATMILFGLLSGLALSTLGVAESVGTLNTDETETVLAGVEYNDTLTEKIQVNFTYERHLTEDALRSPLYKNIQKDKKRDGEITISGIRFYLRETGMNPLPDGTLMQLSSTHSFDGELQRILFVPIGDYHSNVVTNAAIRKPDANTTPFNYETPFLFNMSMKSMWFGKFLRQSGARVLRKEILENSECYVMQSLRDDGYLVTTWIDPNSGYRVRKSEVHDPNGEWVGNCETKLAQWDGGVWFPVSGLRISNGKKETGERVLFKTESIVVSKVVVNPELPSSYFSITFPPETHVSDQIIDLEYIIPAGVQ